MRNAHVHPDRFFVLMITLTAATLLAGPAAAQQAVTVRGSSTTLTLVAELAEAYRDQTGKTVLVEGGGASKGLDASLATANDLFFLSDTSESWDHDENLVGFPVAQDAAVLVVRTDNPVTDLTPSQAQEIFCGQQMSWSHGGSITAFAPPAVMSSARECFEQTTPEQRPIGRQIRLESEPFIPEQVAQRPGAIGLLMAGAATLDPRIKVLRVGGVVPSPQTILDKTYPLSRTLVFTARPKLSSDAQAFIDFVFSEQGQQIIHDAGFLPLSTNTDSMPQTAGVSTDAASEPGQ